MIRAEDSHGYLWIRILEPGGCRFIKVNIYTRANLPLEVNIQKKLGSLKDVTRDSLGQLWYLTQSGVIWKEDPSGDLRRLATGFSTYIFAQYEFRAGLVWLHEEPDGNALDATCRLVALGPQGEKVFKRDMPRPLQFEFFRGLENEDILRLDMDGILLRERMGQLRKVLIPKPIFGTYEESTPEYAVYEVGRGEKYVYIWQGKQLYLLIYGSDWTFLRGQALGSSVFSIPGGLNIMRDRIGEVWIGSLDGLYKISLMPRRFKRYLWLGPEITDKFFTNSVRGIREGKDGSMYFMCGPALYRKRPGEESLVKIASVGAISGIEIESKSGDLYFRDKALIRYEPGNGTFRELALPDQIPPNTFAWSLFNAGDQLWIADDAGLWTYDLGQDQSRIFELYNGFEALRRSEKFHIAKKSDQELFVLTNKGLFVLDKTRGVTAVYGDQLKGKYYLPAQVFYHLCQTGQGIYWLATSDGLLYWDINKGQVKRYTTADGLPSNAVLAVYSDEEGMLWLNTEEGIGQFNPASKSCRVFLESDGIAHNEGNRIAHGIAEDGTLYFGSLNGVTAFHPKDFTDKNKKSEKLTLLLTDAITYNGNQASEQSVLSQFASNRRIFLKASDNILNIQVAAVAKGPSQERFEYTFRFRGLGNRWFVAEKGAIKLTNLPFGANVLEVKAVSATGGCSGFLNIPIRVKRPIYLQIWFIGLIVLFAALIIYGWLRYRTASLVQRSKELEAEVLRRTEKIQQDKVVIEQQARELILRNSDKNRFFANVTHEFRTPLALILGPLQSLKKRARAHTRDAQLLDIAYRNAGRLVSMVDDILMLAVLEMRHLKVMETDFSPQILLEDILEEYAVQAEQKGITLSFKSRVAATDYLRSDQRFLRIIVNNLLSNAFKFTPKLGRIQLELFKKGARLHLVVQDSGRGIHPDDLPHIFERFFQTKQAVAPAEGGSGIGLALSAELSALLGGKLNAKSEQGHGATFELILPWKPVDAKLVISPEETSKATSRKAAQKKLLSGPSELSILVVEDNPDMQQYLRFVLEDLYQVTTAFSGREAVELIEKGLAPALILSDYMMPEMDGLQLLTYLRKNVPASQFIPFVMLTARAGQENRETALLQAVDDYLLKPFDAKALQTVVAELIARYQIRKSEGQKPMPLDGAAHMPPSEEQAWLLKLQKETLRLIESHTFSVDQLAGHMLMGRTNFFNEVKRLTGLTPNQYVLELRLLRARKLIEEQPERTLQDIIAKVGMRDERYFVRVFKNRFGQSPEYFR